MTIKLSGGLGNNMFQYATARTVAEEKGYDFCYFPFNNYYDAEFVKRYLNKKIAKIKSYPLRYSPLYRRLKGEQTNQKSPK